MRYLRPFITPLFLITLFCASAWGRTPEHITLQGTLRDFHDFSQHPHANPDFENPDRVPAHGDGKYAVTGLVDAVLPADKKPMLKDNGYGTIIELDKRVHAITDNHSFSQWYRDVPGINKSTSYAITLKKESDGLYHYENHLFFPLDHKLFGNEGGKRGIRYYGHDHNYHFTYEIHTRFTYHGGELFTFSGDDDVWVYIDNRLAADIGGIHSSVTKSINLDDLGLTPGKTYDFDFYFAERHITGSNFKITTSIAFDDTEPFSCESESFISFNTANRPGNGVSRFNVVSLTDGSLLQEGEVSGVNGVNSIGYNVKDNYIWGYNLGSDKVVRIGKDLKAKEYDVPGLDRRFYVAADVSPDGVLYLFSRGSRDERTHIARVDLNTMKALDEVQLDKEINTADFAFNPIDKKLWFIQKGTDRLYSITFSADGMRGHVDNGIDMGMQGSVDPIINFFDRDGNFYFNKDTEQMYRFNPARSQHAVPFSRLDKALRNGDGARCANAPVITAPKLDYGDAPRNYTPVSHIIGDALWLGTTPPDYEEGPHYSSDAMGDDQSGDDDEDAIATLTPLQAGSSGYHAEAVVTNHTPVDAWLEAWIDFNKDGIFQKSESITPDAIKIAPATAPQKVTLTWDSAHSPALTDLTPGETILRIRLSTQKIDPADDENYRDNRDTGDNYLTAPDGEVEDYQLTITAAPEILQSHFNFWDLDASLAHPVIHTKIAGSDITLILASLNDDGSALAMHHARNLKATLLAGSTDLLRHSIPVEMSAETVHVTFPNTLFKHPHRAYRDVHAVLYYEDSNSTAHTISSSDHFAIRPDRYALETPSGLVAGEPFTMQLKALDSQGHIVPNYTLPADDYMIEANETKSAQGCITGRIDLNKRAFQNGIARLDHCSYSDVGVLALKAREAGNGSEFAAIDASDTPARFITPAETLTEEFSAYGLDIRWQIRDGGDNFTYFSNDLTQMAAKIDIDLRAINSSGAPLHNFSAGCYAKDIFWGINYSLDPADNSDYRLHLDDANATFDNSMITAKIDKSEFHDALASAQLGINFGRSVDKPLNPLLFRVDRFMAKIDQGRSISYPPSPGEKTSSIFLYARAYAPDQQVVGKKMHANIFYEAYCNNCDRARYHLESFKESVDYIHWLQLPSVGEKLDFTIPSPIIPNAGGGSTGTISAAHSPVRALYHENNRQIFTEVFKSPTIVSINYRPKSYLLYNRFNPAATEQKVTLKFLPQPKKWAGKGKRGAVVDTEISGRQSEKLDW